MWKVLREGTEGHLFYNGGADPDTEKGSIGFALW
jgi:hypothetical protein